MGGSAVIGLDRCARARGCIAVALVSLCGWLGGICSAAEGAAPSPRGVIDACYSYSRDGGELRVLRPGRRCSPSESSLSWNQIGAPGPVGQPGIEGKIGPPGPEGKEASDHDETKPKSFKDEVAEWAIVGGSLLGLALAVPLLVGAAWLLVMNIVARTPGLKNWGPVRRLVRRASLEVETLDDSALRIRLGPAVTGLVRGQITISHDRYGFLVSGQQALPTALDGLTDLPGSAKTAAVLLRLLYATLPRRRLVLCGELQPASMAGPGISLAFRHDRTYASSTALWAESYGVDEFGTWAYQRLAIPAGAWADHQITAALGGTLLSSSPVSWAFFRAGLERDRVGEADAARLLYEQALGHDASNIGALANLGQLERRKGQFDRAGELLDRALEVIEASYP
jgi:hypothetical protein